MDRRQVNVLLLYSVFHLTLSSSITAGTFRAKIFFKIVKAIICRLTPHVSPWCWLHVFPDLALATSFSALGTSYTFSRTWRLLHVFPRLVEETFSITGFLRKSQTAIGSFGIGNRRLEFVASSGVAIKTLKNIFHLKRPAY